MFSLLGGLNVPMMLTSKHCTTSALASLITGHVPRVEQSAGIRLIYGKPRSMPNTIDRRSQSNLGFCLLAPGRRKVALHTTPRLPLLI